MASSYHSDGHVNDEGNYSGVTSPFHNDQQGTPQNRRQEEQQLPAAVQAVMMFGYPPDLVVSVYKQLARSTRLGDSEQTVSVPGSESTHVTGSSPSRDVSASALLVAVEDAIPQPNIAGTGREVGFNVSSTAMHSSGRSSSDGVFDGLTGESYGSGVGQEAAGSDDNISSAIPYDPTTAPHRLASNTPLPHLQSPTPQVLHRSTVLHRSHSYNGGQFPALNQSSTSSSSQSVAHSSDQPSIIAWSSITRTPTTTENQSSTNEHTAGRVITSTLETHVSTSSSTQVRGGSDTVTSLSLTSPGVTASRDMENWSSASAAAVASVSDDRLYPDCPSAECTTPVHPSYPTFSSASVAQSSTNAAPRHHGTRSATSNPNSESETRDQAQGSADETAMERRRHLLQRLRALRAENRRLKARQSCRHCRQRPVALTLLPCGHFAYCKECGSSFQTCPLCHKTVLADVRTFLS